MQTPNIAETRTRDRVLVDTVKQNPVDLEQRAIHRKLLYLAVPWLAFAAVPWILASVATRYFK
jgi:hypothetical protein